jgi:hypothetical protein
MAILRPRVDGGDVTDADGTVAIGRARKDDPSTAITKWIPVEVIACYEAVTTAFGNSIAAWLPYVIPAGILVTFGWIAFATADKKAKSAIAWRQAWVSSFAFAFWVAGSTSADIWRLIVPGWNSAFNPALFAIGGVLLPIVDGVLRRLGIRQD